METIQEITSVFRDFELGNLPTEWVESVWEAGFTTCDDLPVNVLEHYTSDPFFDLLKAAVDQCAEHQRRSNDAELWLRLAESGVETKAILALLAALLDEGLKKGAEWTARRAAFGAAELYLTLATLSGAAAYHVFASFLFQKATDCLAVAHRFLCQDDAKQKRLAGAAKRGGRAKSRARVTAPRGQDQSSLSAIIDEPSNTMDADRLELLKDLTGNVLSALWGFLKAFPLKNNPESVAHVAVLLVNISTVDAQHTAEIGPCKSRDEMDRRNLTEQGFACLFRLSEDQHAPKARICLRNLMPYFLLTVAGTANATVPAAAIQLKNLALDFTSQLLRANAEVIESVYVLAQNLCAKSPDKADYRRIVAQSVAALILSFPNNLLMDFICWLTVFARNTKISYRGFAIDLCAVLLSKIEAEEPRSSLIDLILERCSDVSSTVRARALTTVMTVLGDSGVDSLLTGGLTDSRSDVFQNSRDLQDLSPASVTEAPSKIDGKNMKSLLRMAKRRAEDDKAQVRKSAVLVLEGLASVLPLSSLDEVLAVLSRRSMDTSLSVRKQTAETLTKLLKCHPDVEVLQDAFLLHIMPLVTDRENSIQERAADLISEVLFKNLSLQKNENSVLAWRLLGKVEQQKDLRRYMCRLFKKNASGSGVLQQRSVDILEAATRDADKSSAAWMLLAEMSRVLKISPRLARAAWLVALDMSSRAIGYMAQIFAVSCDQLSAEECRELRKDMCQKLEHYQVDPENLGAVMYVVARLYRLICASESDGKDAMDAWCQQVVESCETQLSRLVFGEGETDGIPPERLLFTLGEAVQFCPKLASKRLFLIVEALIVSEHLCQKISQHPQSQQSVEGGFLQPVFQQGNTDAFSATVKAHAVITLGKLCIQEEESAKACVAALVRELTRNKDARIRNNIMVVVSDLCIRYTSLIDRHVDSVSLCLKDPSILVRKQTLTLLTGLLKEDFLRFKGVLLYRFLSALLDKDKEIRFFAEYCIINVLLVRYPQMFFHHFLECLFYFNGIRHPSWDAGNVQPVTEAQMFSLKGKDRQEERLKLYSFMLQQFEDNEKFSISAKISGDILAPIVEESIPLNEETADFLDDSLRVLTSKEIKISIHNANQNEDPDDMDPTQAAANEVLKKAISQTVKKATIELIVPNVVSLKLMLERRRSPILKSLMLYLKELVKDYRNEVQEILIGDQQLAAEIEYDLKRFEQEEQNRKQQAQLLAKPIKSEPADTVAVMVET